MDSHDALALASTDLSPQEKAFVDHLAADPDFSVADAARSVGYVTKPGEAGARMLKKQAVIRYLAAIQSERRERHIDIRDQCIQALWQLAAGWDVKDLMGDVARKDPETGAWIESHGMLPPDKLPAPLRAAIKGVKRSRDGSWEYTFVDKAQILTLLLRHFGDEDRARGKTPETPGSRTIVEYPE